MYSKALVVFFVLLCAQGAHAGQDHDRAVSALDHSEGILRAGSIVTAEISDIKAGKPDRSSMTLERCYFSGDKVRVDTIYGYQDSVPLGRPTTIVQIMSPGYVITGQVIPKEDFTDAESLFSKLISRSPLEIRATEGGPAIGSRLCQVLGYTGTHWFGDKLKSTTDGSVIDVGDKQVVTFGGKTSLLTQITFKKGSGLLEGYTHQPSDISPHLKSWEVKRSPYSSEDRPIYTTDILDSRGNVHYQTHIVDVKYEPVSDSVFRYPDVNHSSYLQNGEQEVYHVVKGQRIADHNSQRKKEKAVRKSPVYVAMMAAVIVFVGLLLTWFLVRKKYRVE